jgi:hypothetical protein
MIKATNGFWFQRDLEDIQRLMPIKTAQGLLPYQIAYLYCNLKDNADRERVLTALQLNDELKQVNALNGILQKASEYDDDKLKGYNIYQLANDLQAKLTPLQHEYLKMKLGAEPLEKLEERRPDILPNFHLPRDATDSNIVASTDVDETAIT